MGWGSGSDLMDTVIRDLVKRKVPPETRKLFYNVLIPAMQRQDWDTEMDCMDVDSAFDEVMQERHPTWFQEAE